MFTNALKGLKNSMILKLNAIQHLSSHAHPDEDGDDAPFNRQQIEVIDLELLDESFDDMDES